MAGADTKKDAARRRALRRAYLRAPEFGLVLGAGVSAASGVPTYAELALELLAAAAEEAGAAAARAWVPAFLRRQRERLAGEGGMELSPQEVVLIARALLGGDQPRLREQIRKALYRNVAVGRIVQRPAFVGNPTLDAVLTFCAARRRSVFSAPSRHEIQTNRKVGGILTTNYDNLVEGAFHTKYRRNLLKPVGRPASPEAARDRRLIPVFHIHGYVGYRAPAKPPPAGAGPQVVVAEDDYFRAFYDPLGFGNYIAMNFLRRFPSLFIGSAMTDANLRRFLFHLRRAAGGEEGPSHFAVLKRESPERDAFTDAVLLGYGVETVWIDDFDEIPALLQRLYTAGKDADAADWEYLHGYRWPKLGRGVAPGGRH